MLSSIPFERPAGLLDTLLHISLTAVALLRPEYAADGTLSDFAWVYLNPAGQRMLQQPQVPAPSLLTLFPSALEDGVFAKCRQAFLSGQPQHNQTNYQADGLAGCFLLSAQRCEELLVVNFTDTNDQPRSPVEQALRESQAREQAARAEAERERSQLHALLTQAPVAIALFQGEDVRVATVNPQMAALWGRTPEQVLGRTLLDGVPELRGQGFDEMIRTVAATREPYIGVEEPATILKDGRLVKRYYNYSCHPVYDAQGELLGVLNVGADATEQVETRRRMEQLTQELSTRVEQRTQELAQVNQELEARVQARTQEAEAARAAAERQRGELQRIFEQAPAAIAVYRGPSYTIELANATVARLWGRTQEQLIGKGLFEALPEVAGMGYEQLLDHVMATGEPHVAHAMEAQHDRNGRRETVYWDFVYVPTYAADGRINGAMVVANEVTAQVLARRQLEQLNQELEARVEERTRQLRQQSQRVERLVQEAPAAIALLSGPDLVFELLNDDYQALFPNRELVGKPVLAALPELTNTPLVEVLQNVYRTGTTFEGQEFLVQLAGPDGQLQNRYFDFIYQARYDAAGTIDGLVLFGFEVTERVQRRLQTEALQAELLAAAERRAQERQDLIRIFEQAPAAICLLREPDHQIDYFNATFAQLFPAENLRRHTVADAYPDATARGVIGRLDRVYQTGETLYGVEYELPVASHPDRPGQPRYFNFTYQAYREQGHIVGVAVFVYEVTEQVLARQRVQALHEAVERQRAYLQQLVNVVPAAVATFEGPDHRLSAYNEAYQVLVSRPLTVGKSVDELFPDTISQGFNGLMTELYASGRTLGQRETPVTFTDAVTGRATTQYLDINYQPLRDAAGHPTGMLVSSVDVTAAVVARQQVQQLHEELAAVNEELAATNEELLASNEELLESNTRLSHTNADLDTFVYTASHDLKAPITNIEGLLHVLQEEARTGIWSETADHVLTLMQDSIARFRATLGHLTEITRLQPETESAAPVDLASIITGVELDLAPLLAVARAQVRADVAACPALRVPAKTARSVVYNLLSNSLKYRAADRVLVVHIRCRLEARHVLLEIEDNGLGIDLTKQTELFGMFRRYHTHVEGAGVGLYMVKRLVEHIGGRIEVRSQVGKGSTFTVRFPLTK